MKYYRATQRNADMLQHRGTLYTTWMDLVCNILWLSKTFCQVKETGHKKSYATWFQLEKKSEISKHIETENSDCQGWAERREEQGVIANEYGVSFWYIAHVSELNRGDSCMTLGMY